MILLYQNKIIQLYIFSEIFVFVHIISKLSILSNHIDHS